MSNEPCDVTVDIPQSYNPDIREESQGLPEPKETEQRLCPLCQSTVRLFFINFNEKFLMCENTQCDFPFGYEELQFVKEDEDVASDDEDVRTKTLTSTRTSVTGSTVSRIWSDIDKIQKAYSGELTPEGKSFDIKESSSHRERIRKKKESEEKLMKHIRDIEEMNAELCEDSDGDKPVRKIKNEKWIKNLKNLQEMSGVQLLRPDEMGLLKKEEPTIGLGELKIDIAPASNASVSSIRIEIHNNSENETPDKETTKIEQPPIELTSLSESSTV